MTFAARAAGCLVRLAIATTVMLADRDALVYAEEAGGSPRTAAQIDPLVAPIALYPDALLAQVLMASTYPLEVAEAARWSQANPGVAGEALEQAMQSQPWDASVKGLTALPQVLQMLSDRSDWTQLLGDTFLARQKDLLEAIQRLRARAAAAGNLQTTAEHKISRVAVPPEPGSSAPAGTVYVIEPATADEYAVPIYDPGALYGTWPYPLHPPSPWYPPGHVATGGLAFAGAVAVGSAIWGRADWWNGRININIGRFNRFNRTKITRTAWVHDPAHRGGVPYRDSAVAARFADGAKAAPDKGDAAEQPKPGAAKPKGAQPSARPGRHVRGSKAGVRVRKR